MLLTLLCVFVGAPPADAAPSHATRLSIEQLDYPAAAVDALTRPAYTCRQTRRHIEVDGYLREWLTVPSITLDRRSLVKARDYGGDGDLSAKVQLQWDRDYLYLAAEVTDDEHVQKHAGGFLHMDDSLLLGIDGLGDADSAELDDDDYVFGFADGEWDEAVWRYAAPTITSQRGPRDLTLACKRYGKTLRYECAIAWSELTPLRPVAQSTCRFSVLVSDRDADTGRRLHEYVAWTGGLAEPRDPRQFGTLLFEPAELPSHEPPEIFPWLSPATVDRGEPVHAMLGINCSEETSVRLTATLSRETIQAATLSEEVVLPKGLSRLKIACDVDGLPEGQYRLLVGAYRSDDWSFERAALPFVKFDSAKRLAAIRRVEGSIDGRTEDPARGSDVLVRLQSAAELLSRGQRTGMTPATLPLVDDMIAEGEALAGLSEAGSVALDRRVGWVARGYYSPVDDSVQPYLMWLPDDYDPERAYPLVVSLHYYEPSYRKAGWVARQFNQSWSLEPYLRSRRPPMIELHPFGRGNNWYRGLGEDDVVQALAAAKRHYNIDPDRVYLTGSSMGGTGAWHLATRHPELFAGVAPVCGHMEYAYDSSREFSDKIDPLWPRSYLQAGSPYFHAANLFTVPVLCHQGSEDTIVPAYQSQTMVRKLRELKYAVDYEEHPHVGHSGFPSTLDDTLRRWMLEQRRDPCPKRVVVRTNTLEQNRAHWLRIDRLERMYQFAQLQAEVKDSTIDAFAWGVREFTLFVPKCLFKPGDPVQVNVMRKPAWQGEVPESGELTFREGEGEDLWKLAPEGPTWRQPEAPLMKRHGLQGPIPDVYNSRAVIVYGTQSSDETTEILRAEAEADRDKVNRWFSASFRAIPDTDVTDEVIAESSLILYGGPAENAIVAKIAADLPIRLEDAAIRVGERRLPGGNLATKFIYPNPLSPSRYVVVNMGVLPSSLRGAGSLPWGLWDPLPDYVVFRTPPLPADHRSEVVANSTHGNVWNWRAAAFVVEGMFDDAWQVMDESPLVVWHERD